MDSLYELGSLLTPRLTPGSLLGWKLRSARQGRPTLTCCIVKCAETCRSKRLLKLNETFVMQLLDELLEKPQYAALAAWDDASRAELCQFWHRLGGTSQLMWLDREHTTDGTIAT